MSVLRLLSLVIAAILCIIALGEMSLTYMSFFDGNLELNGFFKKLMFVRTGIPNREGYHNKLPQTQN